MQLFKTRPNFDFMRHRRTALVVSTLAVVVSLASLLWRGLNYGVEFTGGVAIEASCGQPADLGAIRKELEAAGFEDVHAQVLGATTDVLITLRPPEKNADVGTLRDSVLRILRSQGLTVEVRRFDTIGPQVGSDLAQNSVLAVLFASLCICVYVALRFRSAIVAELHDVITTVGLFSIVGWQFDLSVLAAVLAVLGHSLNDKIVLYDRVRENFRLMRRGSPAAIVNSSVNQVLSRTFVTSGATMVAVVALALFGGQTLFGFSMALIFGIGVGVYSSIYVASAMALLLKVTPTDLMPTKDKVADDGLP
jgi:preprotein translocase subunit SecF